jgi:1-acyl-sn-glycerol-3-phosphate acyltransferase
MKLVRRPVLFTALHLHPILIALVFASTLWWWGALWYLFTLAGTIAVRRSALYLQRPVASAFCALAGIAALFTPAPHLWAWLPVLLT